MSKIYLTARIVLNKVLNKTGIYLLRVKSYNSLVNPSALQALEKYKIKPTSILHIGAHFAQEANDYWSSGVRKALFIEGHPETYLRMTKNIKKFPGYEGICLLLSDHEGTEDFFVSSNSGQSSSLLEPKNHLKVEPKIKFEKPIKLPVATLDSLKVEQFDLVVIDVQGAEKFIIRGGLSTINQSKAVWVEVSATELYEGNTTISEIIQLLSENFSPVFLNMSNNLWGDLLFIRNQD